MGLAISSIEGSFPVSPEVILTALRKPLVTAAEIRYRLAYDDARRGFRGDLGADRGGRRTLVAPDGGTGIGTVRLAVPVRTGAGPRRGGAGAGGRCGSARRRVACGGEDRPFPGRFAEVEPRPEPGQAQGGGRGDEGGPARGEGHAILPVGSGAAGEAAFGGRRRFAQAQHAHVAAHGSRPAAPGFAGVGSREGYGCRPAAQGRADTEARQGRDQDAAPGSRFP